jgi:hypothetical protein
MKYIYLISSEDIHGNIMYKIGLSKNNPQLRLKQLQTGNHNKLEIIHTFKSQFANKLESSLHRQFYKNKILNEWFELNEYDVNNFIKHCEINENIFKLLSKQNYYHINKNK